MYTFIFKHAASFIYNNIMLFLVKPINRKIIELYSHQKYLATICIPWVFLHFCFQNYFLVSMCYIHPNSILWVIINNWLDFRNLHFQNYHSYYNKLIYENKEEHLRVTIFTFIRIAIKIPQCYTLHLFLNWCCIKHLV